MKAHTPGFSVLAATFLLAATACTAADGADPAEDGAASAASKSTPTAGIYTSNAENLDGVLEVASVTDTVLDFAITTLHTIPSDAESEAAHQAGVHEGGAKGKAKRVGGEYVYRQDRCVLRFTVTSAKISVKQDDGAICSPDPFVTVDGAYALAPKLVAPAPGTYTHAREGNLTGQLTLTAASPTELTFKLATEHTVPSDPETEASHQAGVHEGGADGRALRSGAGYVYRDGLCTLRLTVEPKRITVKQDDGAICSPDPFVTFDGVYARP